MGRRSNCFPKTESARRKQMNIINKFFKSILIFFVVLLLAIIALLSVYLKNKNATKKEFIQTHTIITNTEETQQLITASQYVDFLTIIKGKDESGKTQKYYEIQTFKIDAGFDFNKKNKLTPKILNTTVFDRTVLRDTLQGKEYDNMIKPVLGAFEEKAADIAVSYGILQNAVKNISENEKRLLTNLNDVKVPEANILLKTQIKFLPCYLETTPEELSNSNSIKLQFDAQPEIYMRDAQIIHLKDKGKENYLRIGYTGKEYSEDTFESFYNRLAKDNPDVFLFRFFDPSDSSNSRLVFSYASDAYRTAFILHQGKLYYIDACATDAQTRKEMGSAVLYTAMSLKFDDNSEHIDDSYYKYINTYNNSLYQLRTHAYSNFTVSVQDLLKDRTPNTIDEQLLLSAATYYNDKNNRKDPTEDINTSDEEFNQDLKNCVRLFASYINKDYYLNAENRANLLQEVATYDTGKQEVYCNMETYFLQTAQKFKLSEEEQNQYKNDLIEKAYTVSRTLLESFETDDERNEFYLKLFETAYHDPSKYHEDKHKDDMYFFYTKEAWDSCSGIGSIADKLVKRNDETKFGNVFVFVFTDSQFPILTSSQEDQSTCKQLFKDLGKSLDNISRSAHALVFDNYSVRIFPCVDNDSMFESLMKSGITIGKLVFQRHTVKTAFSSGERVRFSDWRKMNIYKDGLAFLGFDFSNVANYDVAGNKIFRSTDQYQEIHTIGEILLQLQHAYEDDDFHYELAQNFLEYKVNDYIYTRMFRPSPRISDPQIDKMERYNYIWE